MIGAIQVSPLPTYTILPDTLDKSGFIYIIYYIIMIIIREAFYG